MKLQFNVFKRRHVLKYHECILNTELNSMNGDQRYYNLIMSSGNSGEDRAPNTDAGGGSNSTSSQLLFSVPEPTVSGICTLFF